MNCYFYENSLIFTFRHYSQSLNITRKTFDTLFFRARKRLYRFIIIIRKALDTSFLRARKRLHRLIINTLCAIIIIYQNFQDSFETFVSKTMPLEATIYIIIVIYQLFKTISQGLAIITYISKHFFQSKHYSHIYSSIFVYLIFNVLLIIIKFYFQNIVF